MAVESLISPVSEEKDTKVAPSMVPIEAWYYNANEDPPSSEHKFIPNRKVSVEHLNELGVLTWTQIETENYETNQLLNSIKAGRGYNYEEVLTVAPGKIPNFEANCAKFWTEHLHKEEEIRFIIEGVGYEDIRDFDGQWIRIEIKKGDLIVLPPGMYHRFTLDTNQYIKALLLYQEQPCRIQFDQNPTTDTMEVRQGYVDAVLKKEPQLLPALLDNLNNDNHNTHNNNKHLDSATKSLEALNMELATNSLEMLKV